MKEQNTGVNVAVFQDGKLRAFGSLRDYAEKEDTWSGNVLVTKGSLEGGEHQMQVMREYNVVEENCGMSCN